MEKAVAGGSRPLGLEAKVTQFIKIRKEIEEREKRKVI